MHKRLLFICETVTLAHIMRTLALIEGLDPEKYEIHLAAGEIPEFIRSRIPDFCRLWPLNSAVPSKVFLEHLAKGKFPYTQEVIAAQLAEDMDLIRTIQPDLVIGDFRLTLAISSVVLKTPFLQIANIIWHPDVPIPVQVPDLPVVRLLGERISIFMFKYFIGPIVFHQIRKPFAMAAALHGSPDFKHHHWLYTAGDYVFYADSKELVTLPALKKHERIGGAVFASIETKESIPQLTVGLPNIVISLGSSGPSRNLASIVSALSQLPVNLYVSTLGSDLSLPNTQQCYAAPLLPLKQVLQQAQLLICSGGSPSAYLALQAGVPILAIPSNLDQFNGISLLCRYGAALRLRVEQLSPKRLQRTVMRLLCEPEFAAAARAFSNGMKQEDSVKAFQDFVAEILSGRVMTW